MEVDLIKVVIGIVTIMFSLSFHESAHAFAAWVLGDPTGKSEGRISLNPLKHIDLFFTILLPAMMLIATRGAFAFGGAKPVRINHLNFRNPSLGLALSALAGPLSNILLSVIGFFLLVLLCTLKQDFVLARSYNAFFLGELVFLNLLLAVFNLIPVPPLDGSRVLRYFLSDNARAAYDTLESFGLIIVMILIYISFTDFLFNVVLSGSVNLLLLFLEPAYVRDFVVNVFGF